MAYTSSIIDLLFEEEDGWVLVDYKTRKIKDAKGAKKVEDDSQRQLQIYQEGLEQMGLIVKEVLVVGRL